MITRFPLRCCALLALLAVTAPAFSHDYTVGTLKIGHPWSRATPGGAKVGGGYMSITNTGTVADRLIGGSAAIAKTFELHEMKMEGDVMKMRALDKGLEIKPGETVELKPGGFHVMFLDLKQPLRQGETIKGQLVFEKAGTVDVEFKIEARGAGGSHDHGAQGHGSQGHGSHNHGSKAP